MCYQDLLISRCGAGLTRLDEVWIFPLTRPILELPLTRLASCLAAKFTERLATGFSAQDLKSEVQEADMEPLGVQVAFSGAWQGALPRLGIACSTFLIVLERGLQRRWRGVE